MKCNSKVKETKLFRKSKMKEKGNKMKERLTN